jgi:transcriptional regulator with XRE-family HTH domain
LTYLENMSYEAGEPSGEVAAEIRRRWGRAVRAARERRAITQVELARTVGSSQAALSRIECGQQEPSLVLAVAIAEALGTTYGRLFHLPAELAGPAEPAVRTEREAS